MVIISNRVFTGLQGGLGGGAISKIVLLSSRNGRGGGGDFIPIASDAN